MDTRQYTQLYSLGVNTFSVLTIVKYICVNVGN